MNRIERKLQTIVYPRIYRLCLKTINKKKYSGGTCVKYEVPTKISGEPHYNIMDCIKFLIIRLKNDKYQVYYQQPGDLIIIWSEFGNNIHKLKDNLQFLYDEHLRTEEFKEKLNKNPLKAIEYNVNNNPQPKLNIPALPAPNHKINLGKKLPNLQFGNA